MDRDEVVRALAEEGIQSKPYLPAIHLMSFYRERFGHREGEFPVCEEVAERSLALPFFPQITEGQIGRVAERLRRDRLRVAFRAAIHCPRVTPVRAPGSRLREAEHLDRLRPPAVAAGHRPVAGPREDAGGEGDHRTGPPRGAAGGSRAVEAELREDRFPFAADDEDIHMAIERRLTEIAGPVGGRLHTARSRNDQVATDLALYTRERAPRP